MPTLVGHRLALKVSLFELVFIKSGRNAKVVSPESFEVSGHHQVPESGQYRDIHQQDDRQVAKCFQPGRDLDSYGRDWVRVGPNNTRAWFVISNGRSASEPPTCLGVIRHPECHRQIRHDQDQARGTKLNSAHGRTWSLRKKFHILHQLAKKPGRGGLLSLCFKSERHSASSCSLVRFTLSD